MKTLVAYYSNGGNNRFIAQKIALDCKGELLEIKPRLNGMFFVILSTLIKISFGIRKTRADLQEYDAVVACGPIYMGQLASPVSDFLRKNKGKIRKLFFATCCGGGESEKDTKFGYSAVLSKIQLLMKDKYAYGDALSIDLIVPEEMRGNGEAVMKLKLNDETFKGKIVEKYERFLGKVKTE